MQSKFQNISYNDDNFSFIIRPLNEEDAELIYSAVLLSREDLKPFMDWSHREISVNQQKERIKASIESFKKGISYDFVVVNRKNNEFLMSASLNASRAPNKKSLGIGYWVSSNYSNKGLATLVSKILVTIAFEKYGCDRVEIGSNKANQKSLRVIEKCGFNFECEVRNYFTKPTNEMIQDGFNSERTGVLFSLLREDIPNISWYNPLIVSCFGTNEKVLLGQEHI